MSSYLFLYTDYTHVTIHVSKWKKYYCYDLEWSHCQLFSWIIYFLSPPVHLALWAHIHRFLYVSSLSVLDLGLFRLSMSFVLSTKSGFFSFEKQYQVFKDLDGLTGPLLEYTDNINNEKKHMHQAEKKNLGFPVTRPTLFLENQPLFYFFFFFFFCNSLIWINWNKIICTIYWWLMPWNIEFHHVQYVFTPENPVFSESANCRPK